MTSRRWRHLIPATAVTALLVVPAGAGRAGVPVLVIAGHGWGHGVGMAQDGAYWMARSGADTPAILEQFYPGTAPGTAAGVVRVRLSLNPVGSLVLRFPTGGEVRDGIGDSPSPGFAMAVPAGGEVGVHFDGTRYFVEVSPGPGSPDAADSAAGPPGASSPSGTPSAEPSRVKAGRPSPGRNGAGRLIGTSTSPGSELSPPMLPVPSTTTTTTTVTSATTTTTTSSTTTTSGPVATPTAPTAPSPAGEPSNPPPPASPPVQPSAAPKTERPATIGPVWAIPAGDGVVQLGGGGRRYRGALEIQRCFRGGRLLAVINQLDVEEYLRGMGEVRDPSWPPASLRAQAIAARTYALRAMASAGEICDDQRCQVYLGQQAEYAEMDQAVADTAGQVVTFDGTLAATVYSANGGGMSASRAEGFGPMAGASDSAFPYLRSRPYPTQDRFPWSVTVTLDDLAGRLAYRGEVSSVVASEVGPSGRVLGVTVDGTAGAETISGKAFAGALGLRSTMFRVTPSVAQSAPDPPPAALQAPPGDRHQPESAERRDSGARPTLPPGSRAQSRLSLDAAGGHGGSRTTDPVSALWLSWTPLTVVPPARRPSSGSVDRAPAIVTCAPRPAEETKHRVRGRWAPPPDGTGSAAVTAAAHGRAVGCGSGGACFADLSVGEP